MSNRKSWICIYKGKNLRRNNSLGGYWDRSLFVYKGNEYNLRQYINDVKYSFDLKVVRIYA